MHKTILFVSLILISILFGGCLESQTINPAAQGSSIVNTQPANSEQSSNSNTESFTETVTQTKTVTEEDAIEKVSQIVSPLPKGFYISFDHMGSENNVEYYVIHYYEVVVDDQKTGIGHTVTYGWYFVDKSCGEVYEMDIATGNLKKPDVQQPYDTQKVHQVSYKLYTNERFGFSIEYPDTYVTKMTPDNGDGIVLAEPDGSAELTVSGTNNILGETAASQYNDLLNKYSPSYKMQQGNWFAASWLEGGSIVYENCVVGNGSINTFIIKYPADKKEVYDSIVTHLSSTFKTPSIDDYH